MIQQPPVSKDSVRIGPLDAATLVDQATDALREAIIAGRLVGGSRLVEAQLARDFGVSRGPVREAIRRLATEGLVEEEPRRGAVVTALDSEDIRDIYDLRIALEVHALRLIAARRPSLEPAQACLDVMADAAARNDVDDVARADFAFHESVCSMSGNARLHRAFVSNARLAFALLRIDDRDFYASLPAVHDEHRALLALVESREAAVQTETVWEEHLAESRDRLIDFFAKRRRS